MHYVEPMKENSIADFTMWLGPIPVRWKAVHSNVEPDRGFVDTQKEGPFKQWIHEHSFIYIDNNTTEVRDEISLVFKNNAFWGLIGRMLWLSLPILFMYRSWITRRSVENKPE